ncbi:phage GP46 family protein [Candidatus Pacearchaeota archaeon]|nr:phage GP46 family protein [Candidatus Pacearchaeota archaeon]
MDITISLINGIYSAQIVNGDFLQDDGLSSAVLDSLLTDRRAEDDDILPDPSDPNKRGFWYDTVAIEPDDRQGSRRWLLDRSKQTDPVLRDEEAYAIEALQWMVEDNVATSIEAAAQWEDSTTLLLTVLINLTTGGTYEQQIQVQIGVNDAA